MLMRAMAWFGKTLGYLVYTCVVLVVCLWFLFPAEAVEATLDRYFSGIFSTLKLELGSLELQFPLQLVASSMQLTARDTTASPLIVVDSIALRLDFLKSVVERKPVVNYHAELYQGEVSGTFMGAADQAGLEIRGAISEVLSEDIGLFPHLLEREVRGKVSAEYSGQVQLVSPLKMSMDVEAVVDDGRVALQQSVLGHEEIVFSQARCRMRVVDKQITVDEGSVESEYFIGRFQGAINVNTYMPASKLDISGELEPRSKFFAAVENPAALQAIRAELKDAPLSFQITGEAQSPGISFGEFSDFFDKLEQELK